MLSSRSLPAPAPATPRLDRIGAAARVRAVALVLHGGREHGSAVVGRRSGAWWRARVLAEDLSRGTAVRGVEVRLLRYRHQGWNGGNDPVEDARWALDRVRRELGDLPVVLVGHSMGARTAVGVADDPTVAGVVALAPWFPPGEQIRTLAGRHLRAAHGRRDRVTSFAATEAFVRRAMTVATTAELTDMGDLGHYLLRGAGTWHRFARTATMGILADR